MSDTTTPVVAPMAEQTTIVAARGRPTFLYVGGWSPGLESGATGARATRYAQAHIGVSRTMNWKYKAALQLAVSHLPFGERLNHLLQRHLTKSLPTSDGHCRTIVTLANSDQCEFVPA